MMTRLIAASTILLIASCSSPRETEPSANHETIPLRLKDGSTTTIASLRGRPVVVNFWATWCKPCRIEMPHFNRVYLDFRDKGVEFVGVAMDVDGWTAIDPFLAEVEVDYTVVWDRDGEVGQAFGGVADLPTTVFVDREGTVVYQRPGFVDLDTLRGRVEALL